MDNAKQAVLMALRNVVDPEVGLDVVTMGLVYGIELGPHEIHVTLTLTSPGCPLGETIVRMAERALLGIAGDRDVRLDLAWEPAWDPRMLSEEGRKTLRA